MHGSGLRAPVTGNVEASEIQRCAMLVARHTGHRILMPPRSVSTERLTRALVGQEVARAIADGCQKLTIDFASGITLVINAGSEELIVTLSQPKLSAPKGTAQQPTKRQLEYL